MKKILERLRGDYCHNCNTQRSIECYDKLDRGINYTYFIDQTLKGNNINLDKRLIEYMRCNRCGECYYIDWRNPKMPLPIRDNQIMGMFLFKNFNKM